MSKYFDIYYISSLKKSFGVGEELLVLLGSVLQEKPVENLG